MIRGHCSADDNHCTFCGRMVETQNHVLHECQHKIVRKIKNNMKKKIIDAMVDTLEHQSKTALDKHKEKHGQEGPLFVDPNLDLTHWIKEFGPSIWEGRIDDFT